MTGFLFCTDFNIERRKNSNNLNFYSNKTIIIFFPDNTKQRRNILDPLIKLTETTKLFWVWINNDITLLYVFSFFFYLKTIYWNFHYWKVIQFKQIFLISLCLIVCITMHIYILRFFYSQSKNLFVFAIFRLI